MIGAYSPETDTHYDSWDDLVQAESNGYMLVLIVERKNLLFARTYGPFPEKRLARNARARMRTKLRKQQFTPDTKYKLTIEPAWKEV